MSVMDIQRIPKKTCCDGEVLSMMVLWFCDRCSTEDARDDYRRGILKTEGGRVWKQSFAAGRQRSDDEVPDVDGWMVVVGLQTRCVMIIVAEYPRLNRLGAVDEGLQQKDAAVMASLLVDDSCWFGGWFPVVEEQRKNRERRSALGCAKDGPGAAKTGS
jgi:hypothetical protein